MATEKQIAANQANAKKSTGPKTPGGKHISSRNGIARGCLAESVLLPNESADRFRALHLAYLNTFPPESQEMLDLVETLTVSRWRLRRIWTLEAANIAHEQRAHSGADQSEDSATQTAIAVRNLSQPPRSLEALSRHEARCQRSWNQALDRLLKIQAAKRENVAANPISATNKELTENAKPIFATLEPSSNQGQTTREPDVDPKPEPQSLNPQD